jgi:hypothetical protein
MYWAYMTLFPGADASGSTDRAAFGGGQDGKAGIRVYANQGPGKGGARLGRSQPNAAPPGPSESGKEPHPRLPSDSRTPKATQDARLNGAWSTDLESSPALRSAHSLGCRKRRQRSLINKHETLQFSD